MKRRTKVHVWRSGRRWMVSGFTWDGDRKVFIWEKRPTHEEALDAALVAVGLAKPAEHREAL